jgi:hypothetical protein
MKGREEESREDGQIKGTDGKLEIRKIIRDVIWDITPFNLFTVNQFLGGSVATHLQG